MSGVPSVGVRAHFEALNVKSGKTVAQLVVDPEDRWALPELSQMVGRMVAVDLREDRDVVVVDGPTGEVFGDRGPEWRGPDVVDTDCWPVLMLPGSLGEVDEGED